MIEGQKNPAGRQFAVRSQSDSLSGLSDGQLLGRFSDLRDERRESAFRELIDRHGPMVMGVCRQVVRHPHDAEDAFQATFLVLVVKARSITVSGSLAPWLHGVAVRTAHRARAALCAFSQRRPGKSRRHRGGFRGNPAGRARLAVFTKNLVDFLKNTEHRLCSAT